MTADLKSLIGSEEKKSNKMQVIDEYKEECWTNSSDSTSSLKESDFGSEISNINLFQPATTAPGDELKLSRILEDSEFSGSKRNPDSKEYKETVKN